jgi:hypothetical protein
MTAESNALSPNKAAFLPRRNSQSEVDDSASKLSAGYSNIGVCGGDENGFPRAHV